MKISKNFKNTICKNLGIILLFSIVAIFVFILWNKIMDNLLIIILSATAFFLVFVILPCFVKKYYKAIDNYNSTQKTEINENNTNGTNDTNNTNDTNEVTSTNYNISCVDNIFIHIYEFKNKIANKKVNMTSIKVLKKQLEIYGSLLASYFCTIFLYRLIKNFYYYFLTPSNTGEKTDNSSRDYLDYTIYFGTILTILVIIAIIFTLINYMVNYTNYWFSIIWIIISVSIAIIFKLYWPGEESTLQAIFIILLYIAVLPINYNCVCSIKKLYVGLHDNKGNLDPAKLTLLWTIIVFILGVAFNIKP